jgi:hypothetical protein
MKVLVMRGIGACEKLSRRPVAGRLDAHQPRIEAVVDKPLRMPSSISVLHWVGVPSSSMVSEPRRRERAVVDDRDAGAGDAVADAS